jgi:hypothetical protein
MKRMSVTLAIAGGMAAAILLPGAVVAAAAPSGGMSANDVIDDLQAAGNNVVVNKVGSGSGESCMVVSVRPVTQRPLPPSHPLLGVPAQQPRTTIHVSLQC